MVKESFLHDVGRYKCLQGNDIRFLLVCLGRSMYPKQIAAELGWKKQNISSTAKKLESLGLVIINGYPVSYRTNEKWIYPDVPGQMEMKIQHTTNKQKFGENNE